MTCPASAVDNLQVKVPILRPVDPIRMNIILIWNVRPRLVLVGNKGFFTGYSMSKGYKIIQFLKSVSQIFFSQSWAACIAKIGQPGVRDVSSLPRE
jgi:hypothetical protein